MTMLQVKGASLTGANDILGMVPHVVEVGTTFGSWTRYPYLECLEFVDCTAPSIGQAKLRFKFGNQTREDRFTKVRERAAQILNKYFRVSFLGSRNTTEFFHGVIDAESLEPFSSTQGAGDQHFTGFGVCHELDREGIRTALAHSTTGSEMELQWVPDFNQRYPRGHGVLGNRSSAVGSDGCHVFSVDGAEWTIRDIVESILERNTPAGGPTYQLGGMVEVLENIVQVWRLAGLTPWDCLNKLINRSRGLTFIPVVQGNTVVLKVQSTLDQAVNMGEYTVPANSDTINLTFDNGIENEKPKVVRSLCTRFDRIEVRANPILVAFSMDNTLHEPAFNSTAETAYKAGISGAGDYGSLSDDLKAELNDEYRNSDIFGEVYSKFRLKRSIDLSSIIPLCDDDGELSFGGELFPMGKCFEPCLPFEEGVDYSQNPPVASHRLSDGEPGYLKPFAIVPYLDENDVSRYGFVEGLQGDFEVARASFSVCSREMAFKVEASPRHMYALNHWTSAEPSVDDPLVDYDDIIATVAMRTDQVLKVVAKRPAAGSRIRTKIIYVQDAECWMVAPGTIIGLNDDLTPKVYGGPDVLRDDSPRLRAIAAHALAWYSKERAAVSCTYRQVGRLVPLGGMLKGVVNGGQRFESNAIVTSIAVDLTSRRATIQSGFFELDFEEAIR